MEARIDFVPATYLARLWLFQHRPDGTAIFNLDGSVRETISDAAPPEPSAEIGREVLEAIVSAASDQLPPSAATDRHLADAIAVRDRIVQREFFFGPRVDPASSVVTSDPTTADTASDSLSDLALNTYLKWPKPFGHGPGRIPG